jgi:multidrug resistance efflux pump
MSISPFLFRYYMDYKRAFAWCPTWVLILLSGLLLSGRPQYLLAQATPSSPPAVTAYPVVLPVRGSLASLFVTPGERVKRGQLLAKLEWANGGVFYVSAPVAGRVTAVRIPAGRIFPAHTILATVEVGDKPN